MVVRAGRLLLWIMLSCVLAAPVSVAESGDTANDAFTVSVDSHTVEYGKSIVLTARSQQTDADLEALSLSELEPAFAIEPIIDDSQSDKATRQWRLYPRRPGSLTIPSLEYADQHSDPIALKVTPAIDPRDGEPMRITTEMPETDVWLRQAVTLNMTLETAASIIVLRRDEEVHDALEIRELAPTQQPMDDEQPRYRHTTGWVVHPLHEGQHALQLPPLQFVRDGVTTHRFYPPRLNLAVRPLPPYLPPQMPVGKLSYAIDKPAPFMFTDALGHVTVKLQGEGIRPRDLPQLDRQLASSGEIALYPAQQARRENTEQNHLISEGEYEIPFTIKQNGRITLPGFRLDYFDPDTGRIVSLQTDTHAVYAINRGVFYVLLGLLLIALWIGLRKSLPVVKRHLRRLHGYIRFLAFVPHAESDEAVVKLLRELADKEGWPANLTLVQWGQYWQNRYASDPRIEQAIEALLLKRYAGQALDVRQVREQLHAALSRQHLMARWFSRLQPVKAGQ